MAIKHLEVNERDSDEILKACLRSTSRISLGISVSADSHCLRILTEWMPNPDPMQCVNSNPEANRPRFVSPLLALLGHVWPECDYLRDPKIVHGGLKGV